MLLMAQYNTSSVPFHFFLKYLFCLFGPASRYLGAAHIVLFVVWSLVSSSNTKILNITVLSEQCPCLCVHLSFLPGSDPSS